MIPALRLDKHVVAGLVGELHHLIFNGGAIARTRRRDLTGVHGSSMEVGANQFVRNLAGVGNPAWNLGLADLVGENRERARMIIAGRDLEAGEIDGVAKHAW